jgi:crotonobetainyl-CoA:carnitine CoA-transferase CaiB-like acyl-CoA transferase
MILAYGVALALLERHHTGRGQKVETSLLAAAVAMQSVDLVKLEGETIERRDGDLGTGAQRCADGKFIRVAALTERQFVALLHLLEMEELLELPEYLGERRNVTAIFRQRRDQVAQAYFKRTASEWLALLNEADIPCGPILTRAEVFEDEQLLANEMIVPMDHPDAGRIQILGIPLRLADNPASIRSHAPSLGEHTTEIAAELGYTEEQIADLRTIGVLA